VNRRDAWRWAALFVAGYLLVGVGWVFTNPPAAAPDEPDHLVKAIGMGRLDIGEEYDGPTPADATPLDRRNLSISRVVEIPARLAPDGYTCFAFENHRTAACMPAGRPAESGTVERRTPVGSYPPFVYVPMGLAANLADTPYQAFLAARLVSLATAAAVVLVGAWFLVRELGRSALLGAFVAVTPMAVFAAANVTASGLEIAGGFSLAALVVVCLRRPEAVLAPRTQLAIGGVGAALILSRQMGVVTAGVLLAIGAAGCWPQVRRLVSEHRPPFLVAVALLGLSTLALAVWELAFDHPSDTGFPISRSAIDSFLAGGDQLVRSAVGVFGWLDTPMPAWAIWAWISLVVLVCGTALLVGDRRERLVLAAGIVATVAVAFASYAAVFYPVRAHAQGRHLLPLFAFCPIFAGVVLIDRLRGAQLGGAVRRLFVAVAVVVAGAQFLGLYVNAHRYAVGTGGPLWFFPDAEWRPGGGWEVWLVVGLAGAILMGATALGSRTPADEPIPPEAS
jgi:hypothetical protein